MKVRLFKEVKKAGPKKSRGNSYYNFEKKTRIYYECITVGKDRVESQIKKGFTVGLPTGEPEAQKAEANADSKASDTKASA